MKGTPDAILLLSGGMDSTTLAYKLRADYGKEANIMALMFSYDSKHNDKEKRMALSTAERLGLSFTGVMLGSLLSSFDSALIKKDVKVPHGHYHDLNMKKTVVPFRNGIMLAIAVGVAENLKAKRVCIANHYGDHAIYPDCRSGFIHAFSLAALRGTYTGVEVSSPFCNRTKAQIVAIGQKLGVPYEDTYSCYEGDDVQCGRCSTCFERRESFFLNKIKDPTEYKDKTPFQELKKEYKVP